MLSQRAPAKVNLTLRIKGRYPNGYHDLDSIVVFAQNNNDAADQISIDLTQPLGLEAADATGAKQSLVSMGPEKRNLVTRAADEFLQVFPRARSGRFKLTKRLPIAAGLGGGSSDAAAAIRLLAIRNGIDLGDPRLKQVAAKVGADVTVCLLPKAQRMAATGTLVATIPRFPLLNAVLVNPRVPVSTPNVFARLDFAAGTVEQPPGRIEPPDFSSRESILAFCDLNPNDMQAAAVQEHPEIGTALDSVAVTNPLLVRMTGSGATVFGIYDTAFAARQAAEAIAAVQSDWWVQPVLLG